jgi:hypothetical protein
LRLDSIGRQAQRALLVQLGAAAIARDRILETAQTYTNLPRMTRELNRFERRGERVFRESRQAFRRRRREVEHDLNGWRDEASEVADRVKSIA